MYKGILVQSRPRSPSLAPSLHAHSHCYHFYLLFQVLKQHVSCEASIAALKKQVADLEQNLDDANKEHATCSALIDALKQQVHRYGCVYLRFLLLFEEDICAEICASTI